VLSHPALNACLNASSAVLLSAGYLMIRRGRVLAHKSCMGLAFVCSTIFLISYVLYHVRVGSVAFRGQGWIRPVYFTLLGSHTVLAATIVPLALVTVTRALREQLDRHKRIARWTLPLWLYVSVTAVFLYIQLYHVYAEPRV